MNAARYILLFSPFSSFFFAKSRIWRYFKVNVNKITLLYFAGILFLQKLNHRKKNEIFHLFQRARDLDYVVNKLTARSKDLISSYINLNVGGVGSLFVIEESKSARCSLLLRCQHVPEISSAARILVLKIDKILRWSKSNSILEPPINLPPFPDCFSVYMKTPENEIFYIHKRRHLVDTKRWSRCLRALKRATDRWCSRFPRYLLRDLTGSSNDSDVALNRL